MKKGGYTMMMVLLLCAWKSSAELCGGLECHDHACCMDQQNGAQCFRPSEHTCIRAEDDRQGRASFKLCGTGNGACGSYPDAVCYDKSSYACTDRRLVHKGASEGTTLAPATTSSPSSTSPPSSTSSPPSPSPTLSSSGGSVCGGTDCGSAQCCLLRSGAGACYTSDQYACSEGMLCPAGHQSCGGACYLTSQYTCVNGGLQQKGNTGTSTSSTASPSTASPSTASPSTASPSTASPSTASPSTASPSTASPSTASPSTASPSTAPPSTASPSTASPSTTTSPTTTTPSGFQAVKLYGLNYSAKLPSGACPALANVEADMRILATLTTRIRIYSILECGQAELILRAIKNTGVELTLTLGIWLDQYHADEYPGEMSALTTVMNNVGLDLVDAIIVGSETQYRKNFPVSELISYLQNTSDFLSSRGHDDIDVVTADVIYTLMGNSVIQHVDAVYANQFPFWERKKVEDSVQLVLSTVDTLRASVGGKRVVLGETGWPTGGSNFGDAVPSAANLQLYLHDIVCQLHRNNIGYFWFEAFDEPYKNVENENAAEKHWGLYSSDRKKKEGITLPVMCAL